APIEPVDKPGKATNWESCFEVTALKNGRARMGLPWEDAKNKVFWLSSTKKPRSTPQMRSASNQPPAPSLIPERASSLSLLAPNKIDVSFWPRTPAVAIGVPEGLVVTRGCTRLPRTQASR